MLDIIYQYKHQLEFKDVMSELIQHKIHCKYNVTIEMLKYMYCVNTDGFRIACTDVTPINVFSYGIINEIKNKNNFYFISFNYLNLLISILLNI